MSAVTDSAWVNDTPCTDWNVKDVVNHIVDENIWMVALFNGRTIAEVGNEFEGNLVGDDPAGVYERTANDVKAILAEPDAMSRTCQISSGPVSVAEYSKQLFLDTLIHGWDIARGRTPPSTTTLRKCAHLWRRQSPTTRATGPYLPPRPPLIPTTTRKPTCWAYSVEPDRVTSCRTATNFLLRPETRTGPAHRGGQHIHRTERVSCPLTNSPAR